MAREADGKIRWKLVWEFLEEDRWEPDWADLRVLRRPWSPQNWRFSEPTHWSAPAAFRKHGVYLSAKDLEAA